MKKLKNRLGDQTFFFVIACVFAIAIVGILDFVFRPEPDDILVEAHGLIFDVILFGIVLSIYDSLSHRRDRIRQYEEEIDDYRGWNEPEASYRNAGNIRRLNRLGVQRINLYNSYLAEAFLPNVQLQGALLAKANLQYANLYRADMEHARLLAADLRGAKLEGANLKLARLQGAKAFESQKKQFLEAGADITEMTWLSEE